MSFTMLEENFWADSGFDELRRLMKQGSDFVKEAMAILQERSEIEKQYATKLQQLVKKARRANGFCIGSLSEAWQKFGDNIENESEIHRNMSQEIMTDCYGPLKAFLDEKLRQRKPLEASVEKHKKIHLDRFNEQLKLKKNAHTRCRELEQNLDHLESLKSRRTSTTDKELNKVEKNVRKAEESLVKADREYKDSNIKTEESRLTWESSMYRCCRHLEELEHVRLEELSNVLTKYTELMSKIVAPIEDANQELSEACSSISADRDIETLCQNGTGPNVPEQLLLDSFEEEMSNHMNSERRQNNLDKKIQEFEMDIDKKEKEKKGVMSLSAAYEQTPDFVDEQGAADVNRRLIEANSMLNMLKATHFKLLSVRSEISNLPSPDSPYSEYMSTKKDRQNQSMTILSIPIDQVSEVEEQTQGMATWTPPSPKIKEPVKHEAAITNTDEFEDEGPDNDEYQYISRCEALYDYEGQQSDELTIRPGDVIYVTDKIDDDWWQGNLDGTIGIFPANYVEEVEVY